MVVLVMVFKRYRNRKSCIGGDGGLDGDIVGGIMVFMQRSLMMVDVVDGNVS